jgi:HEPN domain-containing protein
MPPETVEVRRWLEKADHDRSGAEAALERDPALADIAAFHCQQAVEKTLKAYLVWREQEFEKTHDLRTLVLLCADLDASFSQLLADVAPLTAYAVRFRYPGPADPSADEVRNALQVVRQTREFVLERMPEEIRL